MRSRPRRHHQRDPRPKQGVRGRHLAVARPPDQPAPRPHAKDGAPRPPRPRHGRAVQGVERHGEIGPAQVGFRGLLLGRGDRDPPAPPQRREADAVRHHVGLDLGVAARVVSAGLVGGRGAERGLERTGEGRCGGGTRPPSPRPQIPPRTAIWSTASPMACSTSAWRREKGGRTRSPATPPPTSLLPPLTRPGDARWL